MESNGNSMCFVAGFNKRATILSMNLQKNFELR